MGNSSETQDKILDAAIKHFAQYGYHGAKTADIAKEAGVSEGAVFKYYGTKKDILRGVMNRIIQEIVPGMLMMTDEEFTDLTREEDIRRQIKLYIKVRIERVLQNIDPFKILMNELQYHPEILDEFKEQFILRIIKKMEQFFDVWAEKGVFRKVDPHVAARSLMGMMNIIAIESIVLKRPMDLDREMDVALDIFMNGLFVRKEV